ncbi:MAG: ATP-binding protein [Pseudomonadota bacterium]
MRACLVWLMLLLFGALWHPAVQAQEPLHITAAETLLIEGHGYTPPPYEANPADLKGTWQPVALPHAMTRQLVPDADKDPALGPATVVTWYRLPVPELATSDSPRYIYIPRWKTDGQIAVYGNNRLLYQSHANIFWNGWNIPLWIALDESADAASPRVILVRIERPRNSGGGISSVWLGDDDSLGWRYRVRSFLQVQLPYGSSAAFLAVGVFSLFIWFRLRNETVYLLFFYVSLAAFVRTLHYHVGENRLPLSDAWFSWLTINSVYWMLMIVHLFLNFLHRRPVIWLNRAVIGTTVFIGIITLPAFSDWLNAYALSPLAYVGLLVMGTTVAGVGLYQSRQAKSRDGILLGYWGLLGMVLGGYDWLLQNNYIGIEAVYLGPYSNIVAFLIFVHIMFHRYVAANDEVKQVNMSLAKQLQAQEVELLKSHVLLRDIEHRQTLTDERQRLMQDMHDGLGSSLRTALLAVEKGRLDSPMVADVLKDCIDDLKLTIDSMEPVQADLLLLLATLRYRLAPRLEGAGIVLRWEIENVPALDWIDPRNALHILRILQEAFTNIIKHTQATEIRVATGTDNGWVVVTITDNGHGFSVPHGVKSAGKGLSNQIRRAESIGAEILWDSSKAGTRLTLRLPIERMPIIC